MFDYEKMLNAKATTRLLINLSKVLYQITGYVLIMFPSDTNPKQNYIAGLIPPGKTALDRIDLGDIPNSKIRDHVVHLIHGYDKRKPTLTIRPNRFELTKTRLEGIVRYCGVETLGALINLLHDEVSKSYFNGQPYTGITGKTANVIRTYSQVYNRYKRFKNYRVEENVRSLLIDHYDIVLCAVDKALKRGESVLPEKYGIGSVSI